MLSSEDSITQYSIRKRLVKINTAVAFAVLIFVQTLCVLYGFSEFKKLSQRQIQTIASIVGSTASGGLAFTSDSSLRHALALIEHDDRLVQANLYDTENNLVIWHRSTKTGETPSASDLSSRFAPYMYYHFSVPITYFDEELGRLEVVSSLSSLYRSFFKIWAILIILLIPGLIGAYGLAAYSERLVTVPLSKLANAISIIDLENSAKATIPGTRIEEFKPLTRSFDDMLSALKERDTKLERHREELEETVLQRTYELKQSEERFRVIVEESQDWIWEIDIEGHLVYSNNRIEQIVGKPLETLNNKSWFSLMCSDETERNKTHFFQHLENKIGWKRFLICFANETGLRRTVESSASPILDTDGNVTGFQGVNRDITERLQLEETVRQKERLASLGTFVAGIAHEINNPIGSAKLAAEYALLFKDSADGSEVVEQALQDVLLECSRCSEIIQGVLIFAGTGSLQKKLCDIREILHTVQGRVAPLIPSEQMQLLLTPDENLPQILGDKLTLEQVFLNLVMNCSQAGATNVEISSHQLGTNIIVRVIDNGSGIPEEDQKKVFDPFFSNRRDNSGTGMGLSICHGFIKEHMGSIEIERSDETGTVFAITIPIAASDPSKGALNV